MTPQPHEHEDPRWDSGATYGERIAGQPSVWPTTPRKEELRGEALRRAWLDASYRVQPEPHGGHIPEQPSVWPPPPRAYIDDLILADCLADWDHVDCAMCAKATAGPARGMNIPALICSVGVGILLWGLIGYVAWLTWQAVA